jgi:hypothetical protein
MKRRVTILPTEEKEHRKNRKIERKVSKTD